ncbi:hypothetical protein HPB52_002546 [Rhipicephalus sanguineus]|uniref:Magnesium transporter n=1 Tax=Rhipicephalus sanguineus TaxID=34632 RepID=A0A9D4Q538_RHISA|nr:hypothetical protein HPB52_002546 [Rhipicephalus sanguineus]
MSQFIIISSSITKKAGAMMRGAGDAVVASVAAERVICWASGAADDVQAQSGTLLGLVLAFANVFFNASSFVIKKHALRRLGEGFSADVAQNLALQFASSTAVVAIGMANGLVTALLTATLLRQTTSVLVVCACLLTIVGTVLMVLGVPAEMEPMTVMELELYLVQTGFLVYVLLMAGLLVLCTGLLSHARGGQCILVNICISALSSVPYTIAVKAILMTVSEVGQLVSVRTVAWFVVVVVSFCAHVIFLNKGLEQFDPVRISQLSSCFLHLSFTATMMLLSQSWQEATPYHVFLLMLGVADVSFALLAFVIFQDDHQRSDTAVRIALRLLITAGSRRRAQPLPSSPVVQRPLRIVASRRRHQSR